MTDKKNIADLFALTPLQQGILYHYTRESDAGLYQEQLNLEITGEIDRTLFSRAWDAVVKHNPALRTMFRWEKVENPVQIVLKQVSFKVVYHENADDGKAAASEALDLNGVPFRVVLYPAGPDKHVLAITHHHVLYDGWSTGLILKQFFQFYHQLERGEELSPPRICHFKDYVKWLRNQDKQALESFWKEYLSGFEPHGALSIKNQDKRSRDKQKLLSGASEFKSIQHPLPPELYRRTDRFIKQRKLPLSALVYASWGLLHQYYNNTLDIMVGTTVSGRSADLKGIENTAGLFIDTIPLRIRTEKGETIENLLDRMNRDFQQLERNQTASLVDIREWSNMEQEGELFDTLLVLENYPLDKSLAQQRGALKVSAYSASQRSNYDLTVQVSLVDGIKLEFIYNPQRFDSENMDSSMRRWVRGWQHIIASPHMPIAELDFLSDEEREKLLHDFNDTGRSFTGAQPVHLLFRAQARRNPDHVALMIALMGGDQGQEFITSTYEQLDRRSGEIAYNLIEKGIGPGSIVALKMDRSIHMVEHIFGILKSGAAYLPIDPSYPAERTDYIIRDSNAALLIDAPLEGGSPASLPASDINDPAYIIYTSGSTGRPKGVAVAHSSLFNTLSALQEMYPLKENGVYLFKTSFMFDVSVTEIFGWFFDGGRLAILEKGGEKDPFKLLAASHEYRVTHINFVPSMFQILVDSLNREWAEKLSSLSYIFLAGEALPAALVKAFRHWNRDIILENIYGPTEATIYASYYSLDRWNNTGSIPIGKPLPNVQLFILDPLNRLLPAGVPGELCIAGAGLAMGYLNKPGLTASRFVKCKFQNTNYKEKPHLYKTGDLARWLPDGMVEYLGRMDFQVKVRGYRIELGEIESLLVSHPRIKNAVVLARDIHGDLTLCAYIVEKEPIAAETLVETLRQFLAARLPAYMVPAYFTVLDSLPLNNAGKINRRALPEPEILSEKKYAPPDTEIQTRLVEIWSGLLHLEKDSISMDDNFFRLGGHSLKAFGLVNRIRKHLDISVSLQAVFDFPTIRQLAGFIEGKESSRHQPILPAEEKEYYTLSPNQRRFFIFQQLDLTNVSYNMPELIHMEGELSRQRFQDTLSSLIRRHESLRTAFFNVAGEPVQRVLPEDHPACNGFQMEHHGASDGEDSLNALMDEFIRPFDLSAPPLMRSGLIEVSRTSFYLMMDFHHIIADGASIGLFIRDFIDIYTKRSPDPLTVTYRDYIEWMRKLPGSAETGAQAGEALNLPIDYIRPAVRTYEGNTISLQSPQSLLLQLNRLALNKSVTLNVLLFSVFNVMLAKLCGQDDVSVATPVGGRGHADLENIIGLFIETAVLNSQVSVEKTFSRLLTETSSRMLKILRQPMVQAPAFDVMFVMQNMEMPDVVLPGLKVKRFIQGSRASKFDLTLYCEPVEQGLTFRWEYSTQCFKQSTINRFIAYYENISNQILENPSIHIGDIDLLSETGRRKILYEFNGTAVDYPGGKTVYGIVEEQMERGPERLALIGPDEKGNGSIRFTYEELNRKINRLAHFLRNKGVAPGFVTGIMMERSIQAIICTYAVLKAGGTYVPIDPAYPEGRIRHMLDAGGARMLITEPGMSLDLPDGAGLVVPELLQEQIAACPASNPKALSGPDDLIYIIFTSGSTGKPKGAGVYHRGFMNLMNWFVNAYRMDQNVRNLVLTSLSFDLTQKNLYAPLMRGGVVCLPSIHYFEPRLLIREIHEYGVTYINCTPSMFNKMVEYEESSEEKRLTGLRYVFLGGEPIAMSALLNWLESPGCNAQLVNTYGPTECTDICAAYTVTQPRRFLAEPVPTGYAIHNVVLYIPGPDMRPLPVGVAGELLIGGAGVGIGYVNDKKLTAEKFFLHAFEPGQLQQLLYRTGDLVRWLHDGAIQFLGRIDHQVKVRGFRIELGEIESLLAQYPTVKETLVMARDGDGGEKYLCAYIAPLCMEDYDESLLRDHLAAELPDYMVPAYFVALPKMPLNPNGKVDRKALPVPDTSAGDNYVPPANDLEERLTLIWSDLLNIEPHRLGVHDNFFKMGGHSLLAAGLTGRVHKDFSVELSIAEIFKEPTIRGISKLVARARESVLDSIPPVEKRQYYPLSSTQKRLYILYLMDPVGSSYNIPQFLQLKGNVDTRRIRQTFDLLIQRHESLRTSFTVLDEEPVQRIEDQVEFKVETGPAGPGSPLQPFDLSQAPLLRVIMQESEPGDFLMTVDTHHIISDGISASILIQEFAALYRQETLAPLNIQYKDYTYWISRAGDDSSRERGYWLNRFKDDIPVLDLPYDFPRPAGILARGGRFSFDIGETLSAALNRLAAKGEYTLFMLLLAGFNILCQRLSGQNDIVIGSPVANRPHPMLENIVGAFINTLPARNQPRGETLLDDFLEEVKQNTLKDLENQGYPFEDLVDLLELNRDTSRNPLFDCMLVLQNMENATLTLPGVEVSILQQENIQSKFDLTLICLEGDRQIECTFIYKTALFKASTVQRFAAYFIKILEQLTKERQLELGQIDILSAAEKRRVLEEFNRSAADYPREKSLHRLFLEQAAQTPHHIALAFGDNNTNKTNRKYWSYEALNIQSDAIARSLRQQGVIPGDIVAIKIKRSLELITGILGILKTGAAYLPVQPEYPQDRIGYMLTDSNARLIIDDLSGISPNTGRDALPLDSTPDAPLDESSKSPAYVLYTSGTTGRPKGVLVEHRSAVNVVTWFAKNYGVEPGVRLILMSDITFDASVNQVFGTLLFGGRLDIVPREKLLDIPGLRHYLDIFQINTIYFVPALLKELLGYDAKIPALKTVISGADELDRRTKDLILEKGYRLYNQYGPTETTVDALAAECGEGAVTLGGPISNTSCFILDSNDRPVPFGVAGELAVGGDGVARGYLNQPELTGEKFINPSTCHSEPFTNLRLYLTGDRCRWLDNGHIQFLGRMDFQVKIRGYRVEPEEVESLLSGLAKIKEAVVAIKGKKPDTFLCAYIVPVDREDINEQKLKDHLSSQLPEYMVPTHFITLESLPLTSRGKLDRKSLPDPELSAALFEAPADELEQDLARLWAAVLSVELAKVGRHDNFFQMGGHSLKAIALSARIKKTFSVEIPLLELFRNPTIDGIARWVRRAGTSDYHEIAMVKDEKYYPLSSAQKRLYVLYQMEPGNTGYNISHAMTLEGKVDLPRLEHTFKALIQRHDSLRTSFLMTGDEPMQHVHDRVDFNILRNEPGAAFSSRPFDLTVAPLIRVEVIKASESRLDLFLDLHHIIADGGSLSILIDDFMKIYAGETLKPLRLQYKDYAMWQQSPEFQALIAKQKKYWLDRFAEETPPLELPLDFSRPAVQRSEGAVCYFEIAGQEYGALLKLALEQNATLYMILLASLHLLLSKLSDQEENIIGTPSAGKQQPELEPVIGMFVNTLAMKNKASGEKPFLDFLREVKISTLEAFENQDYPFEDLVDQVVKTRDTSRNPLFDIMFALQNNRRDELRIPGLVIKPLELESRKAKFDISFTAAEDEEHRKLSFAAEYSTALFNPGTMNRFIRFFKRIINHLSDDSNRLLSSIQIIEEDEKRKILGIFNSPPVRYPDKTVTRLIEERIKRFPDKHISFENGTYLSYREFERRAAILAESIQSRGVENGYIGLMVNRGLELMTGILGIMKSGNCMVPLSPDMPADRFQFMSQDCNLQLLVCDSTTINYQDKIPSLELNKEVSQSAKSPLKAGTTDTLAPVYVIYTSGSTGRPKGVTIHHRNLVQLLLGCEDFLRLGQHTRALQSLSFVFDFAMYEFLSIMLTGGTLYFLNKMDVSDLNQYIDFIHRQQINYVTCTPTFFNGLASLGRHMPSLKTIHLGGERLDNSLVQEVIRLCAPGCIVFNGYGPTEVTIISSIYKMDTAHCAPADIPGVIPIGKPIANIRIYILDRYGFLQPIGVAGELMLDGPGVAEGYINRPELTAERFITIPHPPFTGRRMYRTGDLGYWLPDGNIRFLGRIDHQVKVRGFRIELGEIESRILEHEAVREAVVIVHQGRQGENVLCAYIAPLEGQSPHDKSSHIEIQRALKEYLSEKLPDYMVPSTFMMLDRLPLTASGKLNRGALPVPEFSSGGDYQAPEGEIEQELTRIFSSVLGVEESHIGRNHSFFQMGGHSLKAISLSSRIKRAFSVHLPLSSVFKTPTVREIAAIVSGSGKNIHEKIIPAEQREYYPLSSTQTRLYILWQMEKSSTSYNIPQTMTVEGELDIPRLEKAFKQLVQRHESLRTSFFLLEDEPVQRIHEHADFTIQLRDPASPLASRPFDLSQAPLIRVELSRITSSRYHLFVDMHHIISDGMSGRLLINDFAAFYSGRSLAPLSLQYKDFAVWQGMKDVKKVLKAQEQYWLNRLSDDTPLLDLPIDFPRPASLTMEGKRRMFQINRSVTERLKRFGSEREMTLFMLLLAAFNILCAKLSGQRDIIIGTPVANRGRLELEKIAGAFINSLALRHYPEGNKSIKRFLDEIRRHTVQDFENQDYPFEELVNRLDLDRNTARTPLFDVMLVLQNMESGSISLPGLKIEPLVRDSLQVKFDLTLACTENDGVIDCSLAYRSALFKESTAQRFTGYFKKILDYLTEDTELEISRIDILSVDEKRLILEDFNRSGADYPREKTLHRLFVEQAARTPDHIALAFGDNKTNRTYRTCLSYKELNLQSDGIARWLYKQGIEPGDIVAIKMKRSLELITGILGILKSGAAYLPIQPEYPPDRVEFMLKDSNACLMLENVPEDKVAASAESGKRLTYSRSPAYIIYTSGTTGRPKGVLVEHCSAVNVVTWFAGKYGLNPGKHLLQMSDITFDASVNQVFGTLLHGGVLDLISRESLLDIPGLRKYIEKHHIYIINFVPALIKELLAYEPRLTGLEIVISGADELDNRGKDLIIKKGYRLFNQYGPTETTIDALSSECSQDPVALGVPIANTQCYILDAYYQPVPFGAAGELAVGGDGVARGYLNQPELTGEKFIYPSAFHSSAFTNHRLYLTGDRCRWLDSGQIQFLGRLDSQVKIRGYRVEPEEVENRLAGLTEIKEAVVTVKGTESAKYLCAYIVLLSKTDFETQAVKNRLSESLPDYMVPAHFIIMDSLPLTSRGKLDRAALPEPEHTGAAIEAPKGELEKRLAGLWAQVLDLDYSSIGRHDDFFRLGGHSLKAIALTARIKKYFHVEFPLVQLFRFPTLHAMALRIGDARRQVYALIPPAEKRDHYPLSSAQKRLYVLQQMDPGGVSYNISHALSLEGSLDIKRLESTFLTLTGRHQSFRCSFIMVDEEPRQRIHDKIEFSLETMPASIGGSDISSRPFELSSAPLLRVALTRLSASHFMLFIEIHHIIADGGSMAILTRDFLRLYNGEPLPPLTLQYKDYALWQHSPGGRAHIKRQEAYWLEHFAEESPPLELPLDFTRPAIQQFDGAMIRSQLNAADTAALKQLAARENATLFMVLLASIHILLAKLSGQEEIVTGSPSAGKQQPELEPVIGMFVNTLAIKSRPAGDKVFLDLLREINDSTIAAFENQDYPFENLVEQVVTSRDASRNPLFDVMFALQNNRREVLHIPGLAVEALDLETRKAKFDISFIAMEREETGDIMLSAEYSVALFKAETIHRFIAFFKRIIAMLNQAPDRRISTIEMIDEEEKHKILNIFNSPPRQYPEKTVTALIREQIQRLPHGHAVYEDNAYMSYRHLERRALAVANAIHQRGVRNSYIGLMASRGADLLSGLLGIMISGNCVTPISPDTPADRVRFMVRDCGLQLVIGDETAGDYQGPVPLLTVNRCGEGNKPAQIPPESTGMVSPVYVIYTSGSTGRPKGVTIHHRNLVQCLMWFCRYFGLDPNTRCLQNLSYTFDFGMFELLTTLMTGGALYFLNKWKVTALNQYIDFIAAHDINTIQSTPAFFGGLTAVQRDMPSIKLVHLGGERLNRKLILETIQRCAPGCVIYNGYGPTETTVNSSIYKIDTAVFPASDIPDNIPIGTPSASNIIYILDPYGYFQPIGVAGELVIGGPGVAEGYINRPELTHQRFVTYQHSSLPHQHPHQRLYRTGDLGYWLPDGNIRFLGRMDHQVKVRGFRIELGEIESRILEHPPVREVVVTVMEDQRGNNVLCAYIGGMETDSTALRQYLLSVLPDYMAPAHIVVLDQLPKTRSGKLDRKKLPEPDIATHENFEAPQGETEKRMAALWASVLGVEETRMGRKDNFFQLGGHSLKAIALTSRIQKTFAVTISLANLFKYPTVEGVVSWLESSGQLSGPVQDTGEPEIPPAERREYYELSYAQTRLWFLTKQQPGNPMFNMPGRLTLKEEVSPVAVQKVLDRLTARHESLRTHIIEVDKKPMQVIAAKPENGVEFIDISTLEPAERAERRNRLMAAEHTEPIPIHQPPLLRIKLIKCGTDEFDLIYNMHHIISDGWSVGILTAEFQKFYQAEKSGNPYHPEPLSIQYKDYALWQNRLIADERSIEGAREFWKKALAGTLPVLRLPYDGHSGPLKNKASAAYRLVIPGTVSQKLQQIAETGGATLFMLLLAGLNTVLSHICGQDDIIIAIPAAARKNAEMEKIIGMFVNTLIVRNRVSTGESFEELFQRVREHTSGVLEYQDYPLELIIGQLKIKYPDINVFFNMLNLEPAPAVKQPAAAGDTEARHIPEVQDTKFDLHFYLDSHSNGIEIRCHYFKQRFEPATVERLVKLFEKLLVAVADDPGKKISQYFGGKKKKLIRRPRSRNHRTTAPAQPEIIQKEQMVDVTPGMLDVHGQLSQYSRSFIEYVQRNPSCFKRSAFPDIMASGSAHSPVQPWPSLIDENTESYFSHVSEKVFQLIKSVPRRILAMDKDKISRYFQEPGRLTQLMMYGVDDAYLDGLLCRGDFVLTPEGELKCIEYNVSANLGGWQFDYSANPYKANPLMKDFFDKHNLRVKDNRIFQTLFQHLGEQARQRLPHAGDEINTAIVWQSLASGGLSGTDERLRNMYREAAGGDLFVCEAKELTMNTSNIQIQGKNIHVMMEMEGGNVPLPVLNLMKSRRLLVFNGPVSKIMTSKYTLAALTEFRDSGLFDEEEKLLIQKHIPWTRKVVKALEEEIRAKREHLVLKPASGFGGKDVILGLRTSPEKWERSLRQAIEENSWIVQSYIESPDYLYQLGENGCALHRTVWGFFVFGSRYAGGFVRVLPKDNASGVINTHQGAEKSAILTISKDPKKDKGG